MRPIAFAVPGDLDTPTGGYRYDRALIAALKALGHTVTVVPLREGFPFPDAAALDDAQARLADVPEEAALVVDGLALGVLPAATLDGLKAPLIGLVHHPLALEAGLSAAEAATLAQSELAAVAHTRAVVVTSPNTAAILAADYGVPDAVVALPGFSPAWRAVESHPQTPPVIAVVGSLTPRKGHDVLIEALAQLRGLAWTCEIVGGTHDGGAVRRALEDAIAAHALSDRVALRGALDEDALLALYGRASVFALATHYEGFGMVFAEAMAAGLPVVGTTGGAVPDVVPPDAGILVPPGDAEAFAAALRTILTDPPLRDRLADGARTAGARFGDWDETARTVSKVVEALQ
ncbi:glycosyltransferase family 4 protein [Acuticoccus sp. MNP-M23]|uniref:glycosyltransferase family 4 protein n=1 Tax=Acuticoccus sp. MNP-M23 TaxID=3072793 RepID=UPI0028166326|nr:glycosyltransferase family 4 protein [Acuticoccus sp. MNP-M23]WMS44106.1 glycosyltransferase family 4 protein [Acuticoccus sp. MNP-M23]